MIESAARAERFEMEVSSDCWYTWEVPQKPVSARVSFALIDRLEREAVESFRSLSSRGSEIGGILLGRVTPGAPHVVTVQDYVPVTCDYSRGPLYRLSEADLARFRPTLERQSAGDAVVPVGFFRSHTRKGLSLDPDDVAVLDALFTAPHHIALVIRPFAAKASMAGIFFRENGTVRTESSYLEFPFRSSLLASANPEPPPPPVKVAPRAQIVPIASRREIAVEAFVPPEPVKVNPPVAEAKSEVREEPVVAPEPPRAVKPETAVAPPAPPEAARPATAPPEAVPTPFAEPEPFAEPAAPRSNRLLFLALGALVPLLAVVLLFVYPGWMRQKPAAPKLPADSSPLALRVERTGNEILLTWKPDSEGVRTAAQAVLQISDGPQQENVTLDITQFRSGRIVYSPGTSDVVFRMEVSAQGGAKIASESLRVLGSRPSAFDSSAKTPVPGQLAPAPNGEQPVEEEAAVKRPPQQLRPFNSESLSQRLRPAGPADLPDAPLATKVEAAAPSISLNLGVSAPPPPAAAPAPATAAAPEQPAARQPAKVVQAEVVRRVTPEYPKMARDSGVRGVVEIKARVGADGKVKAIESVSGPAMLQKPAVDAVLQWVYKPTTLNGEAVESDTVITLRFGGN